MTDQSPSLFSKNMHEVSHFFNQILLTSEIPVQSLKPQHATCERLLAWPSNSYYSPRQNQSVPSCPRVPSNVSELSLAHYLLHQLTYLVNHVPTDECSAVVEPKPVSDSLGCYSVLIRASLFILEHRSWSRLKLISSTAVISHKGLAAVAPL